MSENILTKIVAKATSDATSGTEYKFGAFAENIYMKADKSRTLADYFSLNEVTLSKDNWTSKTDEGKTYYTQELTITANWKKLIDDNYNPEAYLKPSLVQTTGVTPETIQLEAEGFSYIGDMIPSTSGSGENEVKKLTFYCYDSKPEVNVTIILKGC